MSTLAEKLKARRLATLGATTPAETITTPEPEPVVEPVVEPVPEVVAPVAVLPPDAPKAEASNEANDRPIPGKVASKGRVRPFSKKEVEPVVAPEPVVVPVVEVEHVEPPVVERKPDPDVVKAAEIIREKWIEEGSKRPLSLYIDCFPEKAEFENLRALEDEIAARTPSLLEHLRKTSPKDVPEGTVDLGEVLYGRGYATLTASFALKPLTGPWLVSTLYPASSKVLEVLLPKATFVVRGRR